MFVRIFLGLFFGLLVNATPVHAQPRSAATAPVPAQELRRRLAAVAPNPAVPEGARTSVSFLLDVVDRNAENFAEQSTAWRRVAQRYVESLEHGVDPYPRETNIITNRGYVSPISETRQGYAIYLPPNYDPNRAYPLLIALHGGSSNGNLFLGVVLGNNMDWETYSQHLWEVYRPGWSPDWIVVAPDGFGQVLWRWMGEEDVLSVIEDVKRHYHVDENRVVLSGLSNGGIGAYAIGMRHAWQFSMVIAMAGAPSWFQYTGGRPSATERRALMQVSAMHLVQNSVNTDFRFYHGRVDPGPMRPAFVTEMENYMRGQGLTPNVTWFDMGHDLLYVVHRHGRAYAGWGQVVRDPHPREVRVSTADYRAARQHWAEISRIDDYPSLATLRATVTDAGINVTTDKVLEFALRLNDAPLGSATSVAVQIDGQSALNVPRNETRATFSRASLQAPFVLGGLLRASSWEKVPGLSGPLTDAYRGRSIHVYGTQVAEHIQGLRQAAERGARGWPLWLWNHNQRVVADTDVTDEMIANAHLVLYGTPNSNTILQRIANQLPIRIEATGVRVGERLYTGRDIGTRFIYPNPLANGQRYVVVQSAPTVEGVARGHNLPDFLGDFVVYDARSAARRERLIAVRSGHLATGYFDRFWQLRTEDGAPTAATARIQKNIRKQDAALPSDTTTTPTPRRTPSARPTREISAEQLEINRILGMRPTYHLPDEVRRQTPPYAMPVTPPPPNPALPHEGEFEAPNNSAEGRIARQIARNAQLFLNFRAIIPGATWTQDPEHVLRIRSARTCEAELRSLNIPFDSVAPDELPTALAPLNNGTPPSRPLVPAAVTLRGPVLGVTYHSARGPIVIACELAARLPALSRILSAHGVVRVAVASAYRSTPMQSYHTMGFALDLAQFIRADGTRLSVLQHFAETPAHATCAAPQPGNENARELLAIACELAETHMFNSVLTPNYNDGHRDHFHVDVRPDDPRFYLR